jgi:hypothetical protein
VSFISNLEEYAEDMGGIFHFGDVEAIPYNHWRKDYEWLVFVMQLPFYSAFVPVKALTAREACETAVLKFSFWKEDDE